MSDIKLIIVYPCKDGSKLVYGGKPVYVNGELHTYIETGWVLVPAGVPNPVTITKEAAFEIMRRNGPFEVDLGNCPTTASGVIGQSIKHTYYKCPPDCDDPYCNYCRGGLGYCTVCHGAEGTLTTHCCGEPMPETTQDLVMAAKLDFVDGHWVNATK